MVQKNTYINKQTEENTVPQGWIPVEEAGLTPPKKDMDTFSVRMNNDEFLYSVFKGLAGLTPRVHEGKHYLAPIKDYKPYMSYEGVLEIVNDLRLINNPSVVLGNVTSDEMRIQFNHIHEAVSDRLGQDRERFGISDSARYSIMMFLETAIFNQLSRAVGGRESKMLQTQIIEQRQDQSITESIGNSKSWWGSRK